MVVLALIAYYMLLVLFVIMIISMIMSWIALAVPPLANNGFYRFLQSVTAPVISPFRALLPAINGIDFFSFIFAIVMLQLMMNFVGRLAGV